MNRNSALWGYILVGPAVLLMVLLLFVPMAYSLRLSFFDTDLSHGDPQWVGLTGYIEQFKDGEMWSVTKHSLLWTIIVSFFQVAIGLAAAILLNRKFPGRWLVRSMVILPWVLPGVVAALAWKLVYDTQFGFLNSLLSLFSSRFETANWLGDPGAAMFSVILTAVWKGFPFSMLMMLAALQSVPTEQYEAARIDGANAWGQFLHITLPSISGVLKTVALLVSIWTFNYFEIIYVLTGGGPIRATHIAPTYIYELSFRNFNFGAASRVAVISFLFVSFISVFLIRDMNKNERS